MKNKSLLFIICLLIIQNMYAQQTVISLKMCIERAQGSSFLFKSEEYEVDAAQNSYQFELSKTRPQFNIEIASEQRMLKPYHFGQNIALMHIDWALGNFFLKTAQAARQEELIVETEREQSRLDVSLRAAMLYVNIILQETQTNLLKKRLDLLNTHYTVAEALWRMGNRTEIDLLQTEAETVQFKEEIAKLALNRDNLLQELGKLINEKDPQHITLQPFELDSICNQPVPEFMPDLMQHIPMIQRINFQIKAQEFRTSAVKAEQLPYLSMTGGYMRDADPTGDGNYWQLGAGITFPLYQWNASSYKRQASDAHAEALNFKKKEIERDLSIYILQTQQELTKLKEVIQLQQKRIELTEKASDLAEVNYKAGVMTNLEYLSVQQQFTETQIAIYETQLTYIMNLIKFYVMTNQLDKI